MRKVRFYKVFSEFSVNTKNVVDGYLDDNGEIGYYHDSGNPYSHLDQSLWIAILLECGLAIAEASKLREAVIEAHTNLKYIKQPGALLKHNREEKKAEFENSHICNMTDFLREKGCLNRWEETDCFLDLTSEEGEKILKTMKLKKHKKKPCIKA